MYMNLAMFYFILDQPPLKCYQKIPDVLQRYFTERETAEKKQSDICKGDGSCGQMTIGTFFRSPESHSCPPKTDIDLSQWLKDFACCWGAFLDTTESAKYIDTFRYDAYYHWNDYCEPKGGFKTFNEYFRRCVKSCLRPIASPDDDCVVVCPADATMVGWWYIDNDATLFAPEDLTIKAIKWKISDLLNDWPRAAEFAGGTFTHSFLSTYNYHRWHSPVRGKVLVAEVIQGEVYLDVGVRTTYGPRGEGIKTLHITDGTGYQFFQTRGTLLNKWRARAKDVFLLVGLVIIDSPIGLVACLPVGMAQVSSVMLTVKVGDCIKKGQELGYFQFGGSDFVTVFQKRARIQIMGTPGVQAYMGQVLGVSRREPAFMTKVKCEEEPCEEEPCEEPCEKPCEESCEPDDPAE